MRIGDVCNILNIKQHILRYWEQNLPSLKPHVNAAGHRIYSAKDVAFLMRFKYLIQHKMYTIEGAVNILEKEQHTSAPENQFQKLRFQLLHLLSKLKYQEEILNEIHHNAEFVHSSATESAEHTHNSDAEQDYAKTDPTEHNYAEKEHE